MRDEGLSSGHPQKQDILTSPRRCAHSLWGAFSGTDTRGSTSSVQGHWLRGVGTGSAGEGLSPMRLRPLQTPVTRPRSPLPLLPAPPTPTPYSHRLATDQGFPTIPASVSVTWQNGSQNSGEQLVHLCFWFIIMDRTREQPDPSCAGGEAPSPSLGARFSSTSCAHSLEAPGISPSKSV